MRRLYRACRRLGDTLLRDPDLLGGRPACLPARGGGQHLTVMGQGSYTGLATILAEKLDVDWAQIRVESAPANAKRDNNLTFGAIRGTGGSSAIANSWTQPRQAGAAARAMLVAAAAAEWGVPAAEISVDRGVVHHAASRRQASFGDLAGIGFLWRTSLIDWH
jgi:CO/xanthine dehydrogenase Mo-binding subunit